MGETGVEPRWWQLTREPDGVAGSVDKNQRGWRRRISEVAKGSAARASLMME